MGDYLRDYPPTSYISGTSSSGAVVGRYASRNPEATIKIIALATASAASFSIPATRPQQGQIPLDLRVAETRSHVYMGPEATHSVNDNRTTGAELRR